MVSMATVIADEGDDAEQRPKALAELEDDPAFREFFKLQEGFEWNGMIDDLKKPRDESLSADRLLMV